MSVIKKVRKRAGQQVLKWDEMGEALGMEAVGRQCILSVLNNVALRCLYQYAFCMNLLQMTLEICQLGKTSGDVSNIS